MKKYRGYYIDRVTFNSEKEIDDFIKETSIRKYKKAVERFCRKPSMELSAIMSEQADILNKQCGVSWAEIEDIEIAAMEAC